MLKGALKNCVEWTQEEKELLKEVFDSCTYAEMSQMFGRTESSIRHAANRIGLRKSTKPHNPYLKYNYNRSFFKNIDNEIKAYWLGFIAADGNVFIGNNGNYISIELSIKDIEHLKRFNKDLNGNISVTTRVRTDTILSTGEVIAGGETCQIRLYSNELVNDLINLQIVPNKSYVHLELPKLNSDDLEVAFLRGYFDGNGSFIINKKKKSGFFQISSPNKLYLDEWRINLYKKYNITSYITTEIKERSTIPCYKLCFKGLTNSYNFGELIYSNSNIFLPRKYNKYQLFIKQNNVVERVSNYKNIYKNNITSKIASLISND